ncbi:Uncharacterized protein TCM_029424 [Theobroma cacao]|uniref:Uncharacterized protein n=1 Tax=Theobroma cacao TaxID=3641 RepID=A0A061GE04_THECC|nr:Uncharacterized protein TCM_029424 [Theobroma cacao]
MQSLECRILVTCLESSMSGGAWLDSPYLKESVYLCLGFGTFSEITQRSPSGHELPVCMHVITVHRAGSPYLKDYDFDSRLDAFLAGSTGGHGNFLLNC